MTDIPHRTTRNKLAALHRLLAGLGRVAVAYSGGADSAFLAFMARQALGSDALAITADSPSIPRAELKMAERFAVDFGIAHKVVSTNELNDERYRANPLDRCRFCKDALLDAMERLLDATGDTTVVLGVNVDDLADHRPGQAAARRRGARFPLVEVGLSKAEIRWLSRELGLPTWNKPAAACLSSRIAYGVPVTAEALERIEDAETAVRRIVGDEVQLRVRDEGKNLARIEVSPDALASLLARRERVVADVKHAGFIHVTLDLEGYRQGSHNEGMARHSGDVSPRQLPIAMTR